MSDGPSIQNHRITISCFRTCSTCLSRSQAPFCYCTQRLISDQPEGTFERLRYSLGGDRPSQTAYQKLFLALLFEGSRLESKFSQSGISTMTPLRPKSKSQCPSPVLRGSMVRIQIITEWYLNDDSKKTEISSSMSPTYTAQ